eukprot:GHVP01045720.1.p1 GENE.GHVP01045720.1~~GHVP01045720.1.p1  ORF type:complete len:263 (-),score=60.20 GHVP01045720.1:752-1540(-)
MLNSAKTYSSEIDFYDCDIGKECYDRHRIADVDGDCFINKTGKKTANLIYKKTVKGKETIKKMLRVAKQVAGDDAIFFWDKFPESFSEEKDLAESIFEGYQSYEDVRIFSCIDYWLLKVDGRYFVDSGFLAEEKEMPPTFYEVFFNKRQTEKLDASKNLGRWNRVTQRDNTEQNSDVTEADHDDEESGEPPKKKQKNVYACYDTTEKKEPQEARFSMKLISAFLSVAIVVGAGFYWFQSSKVPTARSLMPLMKIFANFNIVC